jgi:hypothetical protein
MVAGADADGAHLVLADWVEEHLDLPDLAAALRASQDDPRTDQDRARQENTSFLDFRYRLLDRQVMLYQAAYRFYRQVKRGQKAENLQGRVLGLCLPPDHPGGPLRWLRWFPAETVVEAEARLWQELGHGRPVVHERH